MVDFSRGRGEFEHAAALSGFARTLVRVGIGASVGCGEWCAVELPGIRLREFAPHVSRGERVGLLDCHGVFRVVAAKLGMLLAWQRFAVVVVCLTLRGLPLQYGGYV